MIIRLIGLALVVSLAAACAKPGARPPASTSGGPDQPYVIGVPDLLRVTVWQHPDLMVEAPVRSDGKISVPLLDDVQAAGLTPEALKAEISRRLEAFISQPDVTVIVISPESRTVTVVGGVTTSGTIPLRGHMDVIEAVAAAGGFSAWANKNDIRVIRSVDGKRTSYRFDYKAYVKGEPGSEWTLEPGDVVVVPE